MNMAESLNLGCACTTLQRPLLDAAFDAAPELAGLGPQLQSSRPHLFSGSPYFLSADDAKAIRDAVLALEQVTHCRGYRDAVLSGAAAIAQRDPGATGVFMGYDFHITPDGPKLIEINTNAGGAFLHGSTLNAHLGCCGGPGADTHGLLPQALAEAFVAQFRAEWAAQRAGMKLVRIAIVDTDPENQYLAPEFSLARRVLADAGIEAVVCDPSALRWDGSQLLHGRDAIDLVYNRLTDFDLSEPAHAHLAAAYSVDAVVVTPHPHAHALHADKRNLVLLSDATALAAFGVAESTRGVLGRVVPRTVMVTATNADALWGRRRVLFFKPATGFGSRGAYRGDKLTRRVWADIVAGGYVAQALVPPSERVVPMADGSTARLRVDVRAYAFRGDVLLLAARTYAGQTTNFRTPGGGFAPVVVLPDLPARIGACA
jgi:hypothetical protein